MYKKKTNDKRILSSINEFYEKLVVKYLLEGSKDDLIQRLSNAITKDASMVETKKSKYLL